MKVRYTLDVGAYEPTKAHPDDAGFDLYCMYDVTVLGENDKVVDTGVHFEIPRGYVLFVKAKSGLSCNKHIEVGAGVVDSGYTGSVRVHLYNLLGSRYKFHQGDKIAQAVFLPIPEVELELVDSLESTERGENGFGSSGK